MTAHAKAPTTDEINDMLCTRNDQLEAEKAALAEQLDRSEMRAETLTGAVRKARLYAGEHLPAAAGTGIIYILEKALKESRP